MVLPEMHIRLEIDGEVVRDHHLTGAYGMRQRNAVVSSLRSIADGREYAEAYIVFAPVYSDDVENKTIRAGVLTKRATTHTYNSTERREQRLAFVKERLPIFEKLYKPWQDRTVRRGLINSNERMVSLLREAREEFGYRQTTCDMDIAEALFNTYRKYLDKLEFQKLCESL